MCDCVAVVRLAIKTNSQHCYLQNTPSICKLNLNLWTRLEQTIQIDLNFKKIAQQTRMQFIDKEPTK